jgi:hypothetical protein
MLRIAVVQNRAILLGLLSQWWAAAPIMVPSDHFFVLNNEMSVWFDALLVCWISNGTVLTLYHWKAVNEEKGDRHTIFEHVLCAKTTLNSFNTTIVKIHRVYIKVESIHFLYFAINSLFILPGGYYPVASTS